MISPSSESHDRVKKYSTYMEFEVKEYWMVNPKLKTVEVYALEEGEYNQAAIYKGSDCAVWSIFNGFEIH
jgi:Uma2 family endonuclease